MSKLKAVKESFFALPQKAQERLLGEIYKLNADVTIFLENRLLGVDINFYMEKLEKLTYFQFDRMPPKSIEAKKIRELFAHAKKSGASASELYKMHFYAFEAYVVWIDMYGISDEDIENRCDAHLEEALKLLENLELSQEQKRDEKTKMTNIVKKHDNMYQDHLYSTLESFGAD